MGLDPYVPSDTEAQAGLSEYTQWVTDHGIQSNADLITHLNDIEVHKADLLALVDSRSAPFEENLNKDMYFISSLGFKVNGDRRTKENISDLITYFDYQGSDKVAYRDYDNVNRDLTKDQLTTLLTEHVLNGQALYAQKWAYQAQINAAQSFDDLHNIKIKFAMADYSGA